MSEAVPFTLEATGIQYWSPFDEAALFEWLDKIPAVLSFDGGYGRTEVFDLDPAEIDKDALTELVALYRRYHVDPAELQILANQQLGSWFSSPDRFWHKEIFDRPPPTEDRRNGALFSSNHPWSTEPEVGTHMNVWPPDVDVSPIPGRVVLKATGVRYYSEFDEAAFFEWLDKNPQVGPYIGRGDTLYINVNVDTGDEAELSELAALYTRYNIDMKELRVLSEGNFGPWFSDPKWWWHTPVFG